LDHRVSPLRGGPVMTVEALMPDQLTRIGVGGENTR
jgi:hypothetical protein